jgi:oligopeptide/dipeptide ABC transporter ATP-binding protein
MADLEIKYLEIEIQSGGEAYHILRGVNLFVRDGTSLGLVGESGCGKSMTALSILGLLPKNSKITKGNIFLDRSNLTTLNDKQMRKIRGKRISMIFQNAAAALNPLFTALQQVADVYAEHTGKSGAVSKEKAIELLGLIGIRREFVENYPHELSGGMSQRVMIAMALACSPEILLADEPTTGLDITIQVQVINLLKSLIKKINASLLFISHDIGLVSEICEKIAVMYAGRIVEIGDTNQMLSSPLHPYTSALLKSFRGSSGQRMSFIPGRVPDPRIKQIGCSFAPRCEYAREKCFKLEPKLEQMEIDHLVSCFYPIAFEKEKSN